MDRLNDHWTLLDVFTLVIILVVFGILGVAYFVYKLIKGGDTDGRNENHGE